MSTERDKNRAATVAAPSFLGLGFVLGPILGCVALLVFLLVDIVRTWP